MPMVVERITTPPPPPRWMSRLGKKIYRDAAKDLSDNGLLQRISLPIFISYCNLIAVHIDAEKKMAQATRLSAIKDAHGNIRGAGISPWHKISMDALDKATRLAAEFGITPSAQSRIVANYATPKSDEEKKIDSFF